MGSIPAFHTQAAQDAEDRLRDLLFQRDRATTFLDALDEMLGLDPFEKSSEPRRPM